LSGLKAVIEPLNIRRVSFDLNTGFAFDLAAKFHRWSFADAGFAASYFNHRGLWQILINCSEAIFM